MHLEDYEERALNKQDGFENCKEKVIDIFYKYTQNPNLTKILLEIKNLKYNNHEEDEEEN